jgi:hypothetical protein
MTTEPTQASPAAERALLLERITRLEAENAALQWTADAEQELIGAAMVFAVYLGDDEAPFVRLLDAARRVREARAAVRAALVDGGDKGA